jgi:hypothetical protein
VTDLLATPIATLAVVADLGVGLHACFENSNLKHWIKIDEFWNGQKSWKTVKHWQKKSYGTTAARAGSCGPRPPASSSFQKTWCHLNLHKFTTVKNFKKTSKFDEKTVWRRLRLHILKWWFFQTHGGIKSISSFPEIATGVQYRMKFTKLIVKL